MISSRVLLHPTDPERSRVFYRDRLGLAIDREFGGGPNRGTVFFLRGGFLEVSGRAAEPPAPAPGMALWLQLRELAAVRGSSASVACRSCGSRSGSRGAAGDVAADPNGVRICIVEVPEEHPLRRRS